MLWANSVPDLACLLLLLLCVAHTHTQREEEWRQNVPSGQCRFWWCMAKMMLRDTVRCIELQDLAQPELLWHKRGRNQRERERGLPP